jgi:hypothetical protein
MKRLYGRIYDPSTASHGVALWIASLADIPASHSPLPANKKARTIHDTCGQTSQPSSKISNQEFAFLKMSQDISNWGSNKSMMTYPQWVTKLRQACLQRRKSVALTDVNGFSLWRTVKATESAGGCLSYKTFVERINAGMPLSLRDQVTHLWPTVRVSSANGPAQSEIEKGNPKEEIEKKLGTSVEELGAKIVCACLTDPSLYQIAILGEDELNKSNIPEDIKPKVKELLMGNLMGDDDVKNAISGESDKLDVFIEKWDGSTISSCRLSPVGKAIAHTYLQSRIENTPPLQY